jgi:hypothetical protein
MTTLAEDIKALVDLGHSLEIATQLAVADRNRTPAPGNFFKSFEFIEYPSHFPIFLLFCF